jgi:uncharacterized membrane protein YgdD (TMEM256/DUF423 family)
VDRALLVIAGVFGLSGVGAGAFGAHALARRIPAERLVTFETAVRYQLWHTFAIFAVVVLRSLGPDTLSETVAGWSFVLGVLLFSGSLFALAVTGVRRWGIVTPFGGLAFLVGWGCFIVAAATAAFGFS